MTTNRLEAFSDGVMAIIITIMVLGLSVPSDGHFAALKPIVPKILSYILSFIYVGIYWNNHHHLFQAIEKVSGKILWANLGLLFMLTLVPFSTAWMGENHFAQDTVALYGINLMLSAAVYAIVVKIALKNEGANSTIGKAIKQPKKEYLSIFLYIAGITISYFLPFVSVIIYYLVALLWLIPDTRIEKELASK